jgi:ribosomal-protein-alanine N-acetyltransferase
MRRFGILQFGPDRFRVGRWRGDHQVAHIATVVPGSSPEPQAVSACLARLERRGYRSVVTSALTPAEASGYLEAGFETRERLHLLRRDLNRAPAHPAVASALLASGPEPATAVRQATRARVEPMLRRARRNDRRAVVALDQQAFDRFWRFEISGLREALTATPVSRFVVAEHPQWGSPVGYVIVGRADDRGYLQRLAVHPDRRCEGIGRALVNDGLRWLERRGVTSVVVNTQEHNDAALALYERLGFAREPEGLVVLERGLAQPRRS